MLEFNYDPNQPIGALRNQIGKAISGLCITVATNLTTSTRSKKHGGYKIHESRNGGQHVFVTLDTYVPNVQVKVDGRIVFSQSHFGITSVLELGDWIDHLSKIWIESSEGRMQELERLAKLTP